MITGTCKNMGCGNEMSFYQSQDKKYCSKPCRDANRSGGKNGNWKGGRYIHARGYIYRLQPSHPNADTHGYVAEHRLVIEASIGRYLTTEEVVHHKNCVKNDNRLENLELCSDQADHRHKEYKYKKGYARV